MQPSETNGPSGGRKIGVVLCASTNCAARRRKIEKMLPTTLRAWNATVLTRTVFEDPQRVAMNSTDPERLMNGPRARRWAREYRTG